MPFKYVILVGSEGVDVMHMIMGFILASLLKGKKKKSQTLPVIRGQFEAVHALPGRIRFRAPLIEQRSRHDIESIRMSISKIPSIETVIIDAESGSILVHYDEGEIDPIVISGILIKILGLEAAFDSHPESVVQKEIRLIGDAIDRTFYDQTAGTLDLTSAFVILMMSIGLYKILILKDRSLPGGFNLLWWAYVMAKGRKR